MTASRKRLTSLKKSSSLLMYKGPDKTSTGYVLLSQMYSDIMHIVQHLVGQLKPSEYTQNCGPISSFLQLFQLPSLPLLQIKLGAYFPNASLRDDYTEMNPAIWMDHQASQVYLCLRCVAWKLTEKFDYIPHPVHQYNTRNMFVSLKRSDFRNMMTAAASSSTSFEEWTVATWTTETTPCASKSSNPDDDNGETPPPPPVLTKKTDTEPEEKKTTSTSTAAIHPVHSMETKADVFVEMEGNPKQVPFRNPISGYEDVRFIGPNSSNMWITFHSFEFDSRGHLRMMLAPIDVKTGQLMKPAVKLTGFGDHLPKQKNWLGFWHMQQLFFIYSWCPMIVLHCETETGHVTLVSMDLPPYVNEWHGSTPPLEMPTVLWEQLLEHQPLPEKENTILTKMTYKKDYVGYMSLVHESVWTQLPTKSVQYTRRFVIFILVHTADHTWRYPFYTKLTHVSPVFQFQKKSTVEFVNNMSWDKTSATSYDVIVPYSVHDASCMVTKIDFTQLLKQLFPCLS